ncbi:uncharacterized protein BDR25DRAFT_312990 [Lindgomyces ingoldianus]|uniref:Uncharacterized protein n=1 Tax=Lindgomyces ingoldianus TaxID=673940 RepID=A0ACB6R1Z0_9PLEO|nr:uncharacterized protein BDR25DRAFT_312990 [Lindgomyces ingoldianus]KAF2472461.1 hypothetical protein BDR25DRAFT_312990 [Lindgomyces ingoldianus]
MMMMVMMMHSTLLLLPILAAGNPIEPRACTTVSPTFVRSVDILTPAYIPVADGTTAVYKDSHAPDPKDRYYGHIEDTVVEFSGIPSNAQDCEFQLFFEKGFHDIIAYYEPVKIDVWNVDQSAPSNSSTISWNNAPKPVGLFGVLEDLELPRGVNLRGYPAYDHDVLRNVNSSNCKETMTFRVSISSSLEKGGVQFRQRDQKVGPVGGWRMVYNCS